MNAELTSGTGNSVVRTEICALASARRVAAMLDQDPDLLREGASLPRGWQFILMGADTQRSALRSDGFPGLGVPLPDLGLPRLMIVGRAVSCVSDIPIGAVVQRLSSVEKIVEKEGTGGRMALVTIGHRLMREGALALSETQTYALLGAAPATAAAATKSIPASPVPGEVLAKKTLVADETLLFQYSALGFNSHKIHLDRQYARDVEGLPDLVVNGGLTNLLMTEFALREMQLAPRHWKTRHVAPLFCNRPLNLVGAKVADHFEVHVLDDDGRLCAVMEVQTS